MRAELGDRHRRLGQQLEQERLELVVGAVDLVDRAAPPAAARMLDARAAAAARSRYSWREHVVVVSRSRRRLGQPDRQQLARVVPLVQRLAGVDALVALEPDERRVERGRPATWRPRSCPRRPRPRAGSAAAGGRRRTAPSTSPASARYPTLREPARCRLDVGQQLVDGRHDVDVRARVGGEGARRQPLPQNQHRVPSWSRWSEESTVATVMPHTGSIAVPVAWFRLGHRPARRSRSQRHDLAHDRQRDLRRGARADVEPGGGVDPGRVAGVEAERPDHRLGPLAAGDEADVRHVGVEPACERGLFVAAVRGHHDARSPSVRSPSSATRQPSWTASARRASATGAVPATTIAGAGITGSRKISSVPPDRHGLWTTSMPVCSGSASA